MAPGKLPNLYHTICEVRGKVKRLDISQPYIDYKQGKMMVYRLGNSTSFSIGIQSGVRQFRQCMPSTIDLKSHQFELHARPKRMTVSFKNSTSRLSIVEADEEELKKFVEILENINYCDYPDKETKLRPNLRMEAPLLLHRDHYCNDENQPRNIGMEKNQILLSSEANQFISSSPQTQIKVKRKLTPIATTGSFYGSQNYSSPVNRLALSPKLDKIAVSPISTRKDVPKNIASVPSSKSSPFERKKMVGLSQDVKRKSHFSRLSFKPSNELSLSDDFQLTGFSNLGNTCYMNAILQSLLAIQPFIQDLCNKTLLVQHSPQSLYKCTHGLLVCKKKNCPQDLQNLHLRKFKLAISQAATRFSGHLQHDAHEFLCQVLDQLKDEVALLNNKQSTNSSVNCAVDKDFKQSCPVTRTFECSVSHTITCKGCGQNVTKEEILHDLSLDLPLTSSENTFQASKGIAIDKLIEDYFMDEELEYCCEECGCKKASISHKFSKLPRVLILHVKRYDFNKLTDRNAKKRNVINIKKFLDIGNLCTEKTLPPHSFAANNVKLIDFKTPIKNVSEFLECNGNPTRTTPTVRRKLNPDFDTTMKRKKEVHKIESDKEENISPQPKREKVQVTVMNVSCKDMESDRHVQVTRDPEDSIMKEFDDIENTPLNIESSELLSLSEDKQIEWVLRESMKANDRWKNPLVKELVNETSEYDMDCTDEEILSAFTDNSRRQPIGLKGGGPTDSEVNEDSCDSEESGYVQTSKLVTIISDDSSETSANDDGTGQKKDNSLCSLIDQQPILNEFVDDLLIEVDTKKKPPKTTPSQSTCKFAKSVTSPFNTKYRPLLFNKTHSAGKQVKTPSPQHIYSMRRLNKLSQTTKPKSRKSLYSDVKDSSDYDDELAIAIQKSLDDQEVQGEDDVQMRRAIQLSLKETRLYEKEIPPTEKLSNLKSPEKDVRDSVDSGFQNDDAISYPYRLVSVVSHLGSKSSAGHYISDVYDCSNGEWTSYDDLTAIKVDEYNVRYGHARDGYIFFYMYKDCVDAVERCKAVNND